VIVQQKNNCSTMSVQVNDKDETCTVMVPGTDLDDKEVLRLLYSNLEMFEKMGRGWTEDLTNFESFVISEMISRIEFENIDDEKEFELETDTYYRCRQDRGLCDDFVDHILVVVRDVFSIMRERLSIFFVNEEISYMKEHPIFKRINEENEKKEDQVFHALISVANGDIRYEDDSIDWSLMEGGICLKHLSNVGISKNSPEVNIIVNRVSKFFNYFQLKIFRLVCREVVIGTRDRFEYKRCREFNRIIAQVNRDFRKKRAVKLYNLIGCSSLILRYQSTEIKELDMLAAQVCPQRREQLINYLNAIVGSVRLGVLAMIMIREVERTSKCYVSDKIVKLIQVSNLVDHQPGEDMIYHCIMSDQYAKFRLLEFIATLRDEKRNEQRLRSIFTMVD